MTYNEALEQSTKYFQDDLFPAYIFLRKYALRDNEDNLLEATPKEMFERIAREIIRIEEKKFRRPLSFSLIFSLLDKFQYLIPAGSCLYGIGNKHQYVSLSNCVVMDSVEDSYGGICYSDQQIVNLSKRRCGVGLNISKLRPNGSTTTNSSHASTGIIPFMERFSNSIREVGQNARRGASIQCLHISHPQILDFIKSKQDLTKITGANISVQSTDEFLQAVLNKDKFKLRFPVSGESKTSRLVEAQDIWHELVHCAWQTGEPGLYFWDTVLRESPADCYEEFKSIGSNPCQSGYDYVLSDHGLKLIKNLKIGDRIWSKDGFTTIINIINKGKQKTYKYYTSVGEICTTTDHLIVSKNNKIKISCADSIDVLCCQISQDEIIPDPQAIMDGLVIGDGFRTDGNAIYLCIGESDQDYFQSIISKFINHKLTRNYIYNVTSSLSKKDLPSIPNRKIPDKYFFGSFNSICNFLKGLFSANASVGQDGITLSSTSQYLIKQTQILLSTIGIKSSINIVPAMYKKFPNNIESLCKAKYNLLIYCDKDKFCKLVGFIQEYKNKKLNLLNKSPRRKKTQYKILSIIENESEDVYEITVSNNSHTYWSNGLNVGNCGEQFLRNDSCRLLMLNLFSFVEHPFTKQARFEWKKFFDYCKLAQRIQDDIVDLELECIQKIIDKIKSDPEPENIKQIELDTWLTLKESCERGRRTGTGFTALADVFAALNIQYGSDESILLAEKISLALKFACYASSIEMAQELGSFPAWNKETEVNSPFLQRFINEVLEIEGEVISGKDIYEKLQKYGRRNIGLTTISPGGTISIEAGTTSGVEPLFEQEYQRKLKGNEGDYGFKVDFVDKTGDMFMNFDIIHPKLKLWQEINKKQLDKSPYFKCIANKINPQDKIKLISAIQKHICNSISHTLSIPNNYSKEQLGELFLFAWKSNLKGITVYRDGCRDGVLTKKVKNLENREKELPCDVYHPTVEGRQYFVLVGLKDGKPYEVFAGKDGFLPIEVKKGKIIRKRKGYYVAEFENSDMILSPISASASQMEEMVTRLASATLRLANGDVKHLVEQLERVGGATLHSFAKAVSRVLKKYIPDNTIVEGEKCPQCQSPILRKDGCWVCSKCEWSKCS